METPVIILVVTFIIFLLMNVPIAVSIGLSTLITLIYTADLSLAAQASAQRLATGIDSFALLAIPFFVLSGLLMGKGGIARRLIDFANSLVGRFTGGLSYVNVLTCMMFGSISGSAVAAVSSVGGFMIPEMNKKGYGKEFNVSVTTTAATTGLMIPPSNIMIVYALVATQSVAAMFMAGVFPGIIFGLALMVVCGIISKKRGYGTSEKLNWAQTFQILKVFLIGLVITTIILTLTIKGFLPDILIVSIAVVYLIISLALIHFNLTTAKTGQIQVVKSIMACYMCWLPVIIVPLAKLSGKHLSGYGPYTIDFSIFSHKFIYIITINFILSLIFALFLIIMVCLFATGKATGGARIFRAAKLAFIGWYPAYLVLYEKMSSNTFTATGASLRIIIYAFIVSSLVYLYSTSAKESLTSIALSLESAIMSLLLMVIVLGGILKGFFTATEAAAVAVVYSFLLAVVVYREVKIKDLPQILLQCGITTAIVMILVGTSTAMSWLMATQKIPQEVSAALISISDNKYVILLIINLLLLFVGTFMDMTPAVLIFTPIFLPVVTSPEIGLHPVHFGAVMVANLCIGICTPPVGTCLFVGCGVGNTTIAKIIKHLIPFFIAMIAALMLVTYIPAVSMWLPKVLKLVGGG